ncbi:MAG: hypothetical protein NTZ97_02750 [Candidatus Moranbacteria bacterium]|nr:hypothetical protein [Candidatus Moranbacteria bacterium]
MSLSKKLFIFSSALLAIVLIFWGIYFLVFRKPAPPAVPAVKLEETVPVAEVKKLEKSIPVVSDEAVLAPVFDERNKTIKYYTPNGKTYEIDLDGINKKTLSDKDLPGLSGIFWSPDRTKVISQFSGAGKNTFFYYDYAEKTGVPLKNNIDTVVWQNDAKILYKYYDPVSKKRDISVADPDGSNWSKVTDVEFRDIAIAPIPQTGLLSFWNQPDAYTETKFQSASILGEKKTLLGGKFGADYLWSLDGSTVLISHANERGGQQIQLSAMNSNGGELRSLGIPTFISKCVWSKDNKTVFYALPASIPAGMILPNDYLSGKFKTTDTFWKADVKTGEKERIVDPVKIESQFDAANLFLNTDESQLFFVNKVDSKLYRIGL